ncbi:unnamed protein product [Mytilus coruscus]|uniref:B box-type domain-containing protein n=1 Tax=Mytilus coruscus TaxID=42192 RepID=A0A6J8AUZ4_MYTCO|nr:unnamed protein product [Mytilus coruscus]
MADNEVCAGCLRDNEEEIAVMWCNDCEEPVCRPCGKAHRRFAIPHDVIDIKDISNVSKTMSKMCKEQIAPFLSQTTQANLQDIEKAETEESEVNLFHLVKHLDISQLSDEENLQLLENDISNVSLQFIPENFTEKVDAMLNEFSHDTQTTTSLKGQQSGNKGRQSQLHIHSDEKQSLSQNPTFYAGWSSKFYACCFIDENEVIVIESMEEQNDWGSVGTTLYLKAINLKDGKCSSFNICNGCSDICKDTICTFDRNNILIVAGDKKSVKYIKQKKCHFISWIDYNGQVSKTINLPDNICDLDIIENRVYCTFNDVNHVTYTSFSGATNTCYTSLDLRERCKIAVWDSMIFLLEKDRNSVYKVDITTKQRSVFLKDEITNPTHMSFGRKSKQLAVTCDEGKCLKILNTCF